MVRADPDPAPAPATGRQTRRDLLAEYMAQVRSFVGTTALRPLQVVVDAADGIGGMLNLRHLSQRARTRVSLKDMSRLYRVCPFQARPIFYIRPCAPFAISAAPATKRKLI